MPRAITIVVAACALAVCLSQQARAQQNCRCPKGKILACINPTGGLSYTTPQGTSGYHSMPVPPETMIAGMTYVLKPAAEKQAYLQTLSSQDRQLILANISTITASVQNLQASHTMYLQEVRAKGIMAPQVEKLNGNGAKMMNKVAAPN